MVAGSVSPSWRDAASPQPALYSSAATALKLYPIAAVGALRGRRTRLVLLLAVAVYVLATLQDIRLIVAWDTARSPLGATGLTTNAATLLAMGAGSPRYPPDGSRGSNGSCPALAWRLPDRERRHEGQGRIAPLGHRSTSRPYVLGPSWDYRLIFLLLTLPMAIEVARSMRPALLVITLLVLWLSCGGSPFRSSWSISWSSSSWLLLCSRSCWTRWPFVDAMNGMSGNARRTARTTAASE